MRRAMESSLLVKISSGKNFKLTVHLNMKTLPKSKEFLRYSTGKVERKGKPSATCNPAQMVRQTTVSRRPVPMSSTRSTPGA
jgi:hypothetical protein